eukprot:15755187-Heterocapsa_arctica.AAC.1
MPATSGRRKPAVRRPAHFRATLVPPPALKLSGPQRSLTGADSAPAAGTEGQARLTPMTSLP